MGQGENKMAYSYHNFIFPFIWQLNKEKFDDIRNFFKNNGVWVDDDLIENEWSQIKTSNHSIRADGLNVNKLKYATYQYFKPAVRDAIFGGHNTDNQKEIVQSFSFNPIKEKNARYIIKKNDNEYNLKLADIKLRLYNTGVGLLVFVCENFQCKHLDDIKCINEYGRHITLPFIPDDANNSIFVDSIRVKLDQKEDETEENFRANIEAFNKSEGEEGKNNPNPNHIADFIKKILNYAAEADKKTWTFTTNKENKNQKGYWYIEPALDDRMFVMCVVNEDYQIFFNTGGRCSPFEYINALGLGRVCSEEKCPDYENFEKSLYEFIFCDYPGGCSCSFRPMRQQLIKDHVYYRWISQEYGTFYSVAAQAFTCVTNWDVGINYFRTEYYEMICLVLAQRASIRAMQNEASKLSVQMDKDDQRKEIANLQEKLIMFQNQINHYEVSSQEQAIELYEMMREIFLVNKYTGLLQEQLDGMYNVANIRQSDKFSRLGWAIAIVAIVVALPSFINDFAAFPEEWKMGEDALMKYLSLPEQYWIWIIVGKFVLLVLVIVIAIWNYKKK